MPAASCRRARELNPRHRGCRRAAPASRAHATPTNRRARSRRHRLDPADPFQTRYRMSHGSRDQGTAPAPEFLTDKSSSRGGSAMKAAIIGSVVAVAISATAAAQDKKVTSETKVSGDDAKTVVMRGCLQQTAAGNGFLLLGGVAAAGDDLKSK